MKRKFRFCLEGTLWPKMEVGSCCSGNLGPAQHTTRIVRTCLRLGFSPTLGRWWTQDWSGAPRQMWGCSWSGVRNPYVVVRWALRWGGEAGAKRMQSGPPTVSSHCVLELVLMVVILVVGQGPTYFSGVVRLPGCVAWGSETGSSKDGSLGPRR